MYPEVEQYIQTLNEADAWYKKAIEENRAAYENARYIGDALVRERRYNEYWRADERYRVEYRQRTQQAWNALKASDDPLVRYIAENCDGYKGHARMILEILPATHAEMRAVAYSNGWCQTFDKFALGAVREKLIKDERPLVRRRLEKELRETIGGGRQFLSLLKTIDDYMQSEVKRELGERRKEALARLDKLVAEKTEDVAPTIKQTQTA